MAKVVLGPRDADMLMDGLVALEGEWQDADPEPSAAEQTRRVTLMRKLKAVSDGRKRPEMTGG